MNGLSYIVGRLAQGAAVLTVNTRLWRYLRGEFDRAMLDKGLLSWKDPQIFPAAAFLESLWAGAYPSRPLLSELRSKALWERVAASDSLPAAPEASYRAYSICREYGIRLPEDIYLTEEARALKRWASVYEEELKRLGFVDRGEAWGPAIEAVKKGVADVPKDMILAGFDELTPSFKALIEALNGRGVAVERWPGQADPRASITIRPFEDEREEVVQAARWVRGLSMIGPGKRIGIIVPELERYRDMIEREFAAELNPASVCGTGLLDVFNISLGRPLYEEPLVKSALDMISLGEGKADLKRISPVLLSPYFSGGVEALSLARLDGWLKEKNCLKASLYDLRQIAVQRPELKAFSARLDAWIRGLREARKKGPPSAWARHFSSILKDAGWLEPVKLSSAEFQAFDAWNRLLEGLSSLDDIAGELTRTEAVKKAMNMAFDTVHQKETGYSPVQVLGLLESAGQSFDHLWLMGCHEYALPGEPSPNPFIPMFLQRKYDLPRATHERELEFARAAARRLMGSSAELTVSWPKRSGDKDLLLSPLFKGLGSVDGSRITASMRLKDAVRKENSLEDMPAEDNIPVTDEELGTLTGGTSIIKNQSLCPFRAFAIHRLGAKTIAEPEPGLPAKDRGTILHSVLKTFWEKAAGSESLKKMINTGGLDKAVTEAIEEGFKEVRLSPPFSTRFIEIEKDRLGALLKDWAKVESVRQGFSVKRMESEREIDIGGLKIKERPDRVDALEDGSLVIIDYKSGEVDRNDWLTARPREPQLIVYCLYGRYNAVTFARIAPGECKFVGLARDEGVLPGIKPFDADKLKEKAGVEGWEGLMGFWKDTIEGLVRDFKEGNTEADPLENGGPQGSACSRCELSALCRVSDAGHDDE